MPHSRERVSGWLTPKWLVVGVALIGFALVAGYDLRLGMAAGAVVGSALLMWLYVGLRYGTRNDAASGRTMMVARVRQHSDNRRAAAVRAMAASRAQQGADPSQRP